MKRIMVSSIFMENDIKILALTVLGVQVFSPSPLATKPLLILYFWTVRVLSRLIWNHSFQWPCVSALQQQVWIFKTTRKPSFFVWQCISGWLVICQRLAYRQIECPMIFVANFVLFLGSLDLFFYPIVLVLSFIFVTIYEYVVCLATRTKICLSFFSYVRLPVSEWFFCRREYVFVFVNLMT